MILLKTISNIVLQATIVLTVSKISYQDKDNCGIHTDLRLESLTRFSPPPCDPEVDFLYIIHTAPNHFGLRNALRNSWASTTIVNDQYKRSRRVFLIGASNETIERSNKEEHETYGDIFMYDRVDAYRNMTIKVLIFLYFFMNKQYL